MASPFSGRAGRLAAMWGVDQANANAARVSDLLNQGQANALGAVGAGRTASLDALNQGYAAAAPEYQGAIARYQPWAEAGKGALGLYQNSLGLGGAAGNASARAAFQASPGYEWQVDQATDAVARKASALGALGSGNTQAAITDRASNLANQEYGGWQERLNGLSTLGYQAAGSQANLQQGLGNLHAQQGRDLSGVHRETAAREAGIYGNFAGLGASNLANLGQQTLDLGSAGLMAGQQAAGNRLNFGMNLASLGAGLAGRYFGGKQNG
ncbi:hypothetical protein FG93_01094 [Bosea sp. LC85]|uniref:hypothetical protein n=1 Tax=Bosea sp. LC85 TaxID=1502851 RepID=UPI0004E4190E|nr:hypothetical protein [Bosea sp. LC85]KFC74508.1 hypothetical protein FG93_01094 [Bosea sp. LC85]